MAETIIINSVAGGEQDLEVSADQLTSRQAKPIAYARKVPFVLSATLGTVNRLQGLVPKTVPTVDEHFYCQFDRSRAPIGETLVALRAKGQSCFAVNGGNEPSVEPDYVPGQTWITLGSMGTNEFNHWPGQTLQMSLAEIEAYMYARIVPRPGVKYGVANHEYAWFLNADPNQGALHYWNNVPNKNGSFVSAMDNNTYTLQQVFDQGGVDLLNQHLHARRRQVSALWCMIWRDKNPGTWATNGDTCPFSTVNINGDAGQYSFLNYESIPYDVMRVYASINHCMGPVTGGQVTLNNRSYNLTGIEADYYDFFIQYYYPFEVFWTQSDMNDMLSTNDPAKNTIDYWYSKTWFSRHHIYQAAITYMLRKRVLELHKQNGGKDLTNYRVIDMHEHMYEGGETFVTTDNSSRTYPTQIGTGPSSFMKWVHQTVPGTNQRLYLHKELIWTRIIQDCILYWGTLCWWETFSTEYNKGKWAVFHQRSQEFHQHALDHIMVDNDVWKGGSGKEVMLEGIQMRYRQNGGAWTEWFGSLSPIKARWGTNRYRPYMLRAARPAQGKYFYAFFTGQEDTDTTDIEWMHNGQAYSVTLTGCMPKTRTIRENL